MSNSGSGGADMYRWLITIIILTISLFATTITVVALSWSTQLQRPLEWPAGALVGFSPTEPSRHALTRLALCTGWEVGKQVVVL